LIASDVNAAGRLWNPISGANMAVGTNQDARIATARLVTIASNRKTLGARSRDAKIDFEALATESEEEEADSLVMTPASEQDSMAMSQHVAEGW